MLLCPSALQDWIYNQLLDVSEPLHPSFPALLQDFVESVLVSAIKSPPRGSHGQGSAASSAKNHAPFTAEEVNFIISCYSYCV